MKIAVVSDTHGSVAGWQRARSCLGEVDVVIHCGDVLYSGPRNPQPEGYSPGTLAEMLNAHPTPLLIVRGNCDAEIDLAVLSVPIASPFLVYEVDGVRIVAAHGHLLPHDEWAALGARWHASLLLSGHTHRGSLVREKGILFLNPGSPALPKELPTAAVVDTSARRAALFNLSSGTTVSELTF